ncbi:GAF domain-containing protein, partial [Desulfovibrio sp. OttesenSCG-928-I05]|nr:GAF domain-containing protein [Desulfovibrio sp. OttesenSCG-928-I05]
MNEVATLLLGSNIETFDGTLFACMDKIGTTLAVDRVYIWKNHYEGEELYCTQVYEWSGGAEPQQGNELTISVPFPDDWYSRLSCNKCVNGIVRTFPGVERGHLEAQGIISILVVPVFLHNEFWGFVGFDDCRAERFFADAEEAILRSVSLLFATSLLRNEMTVSLVNAKEEALSSARAKT